MADKWPLANGVWSNAANWNGGTKPLPEDTVYLDGRTITIDENVTVATITQAVRSGGTVNGALSWAIAGLTVMANLVCFSGTMMTFVSAGRGDIVGNITGGATGTSPAISHSAAGDLYITGNILGGHSNASATGLTHAGAAGQVRITGNVTGGPLGPGLQNLGAGTIRVTGNIYGATSGTGLGANNNGVGTYYVTGSCVGGNNYGLTNASVGSVYVDVAVGSSINVHAGVRNVSTGVCQIGLSRGGPYPNDGAINVAYGSEQASGVGVIIVDAIEYGSGGWPATAGRHYFRATGTNYCHGRESNNGPVVAMGEAGADHPAPADVRLGTAFNFGSQTGTLAVPPAGSVALGVPVDATTGTAAITQQAIADAVGPLIAAYGS